MTYRHICFVYQTCKDQYLNQCSNEFKKITYRYQSLIIDDILGEVGFSTVVFQSIPESDGSWLEIERVFSSHVLVKQFT